MDGRFGFNQRSHAQVLVHAVLGEVRGAEGGQFGVLELQALGAGEKFLVFGVGTGPAAFDIVDAEFIQFLGDGDFVVNGEGDGFALSAVAKRRVKSLDAHIICWLPLLLATAASFSCGTPASLRFLRNGIISRSSLPTRFDR